MSQLLSLGAINKLTGEYVYPKIANKKDEYICPECNKDLILVQGDIRVHHCRHKVDSINPRVNLIKFPRFARERKQDVRLAFYGNMFS
jgi:DNA-directed RNA polymerase subunit RPC12/RpoP